MHINTLSRTAHNTTIFYFHHICFTVYLFRSSLSTTTCIKAIVLQGMHSTDNGVNRSKSRTHSAVVTQTNR